MVRAVGTHLLKVNPDKLDKRIQKNGKIAHKYFKKVMNNLWWDCNYFFNFNISKMGNIFKTQANNKSIFLYDGI